MGAPSPADRADMLRALLRGVAHSLTDAQTAALAEAAHGFVAADLAALVGEAAMTALRRVVAASSDGGGGGGAEVGAAPASSSGGELRVRVEDFRAAEARVRPSAMREVALELPKARKKARRGGGGGGDAGSGAGQGARAGPHGRCPLPPPPPPHQVSGGDVGGLDDVKQQVREAVEWPFRRADALARLGAKPPRGVLLYGPPGCSKTLLGGWVGGWGTRQRAGACTTVRATLPTTRLCSRHTARRSARRGGRGAPQLSGGQGPRAAIQVGGRERKGRGRALL